MMEGRWNKKPDYVLVPGLPQLCGMKPPIEMPPGVREVIVCVLGEFVDYGNLPPAKAKELETVMWFKLYETGMYNHLPDVRTVVLWCKDAIEDIVKCP